MRLNRLTTLLVLLCAHAIPVTSHAATLPLETCIEQAVTHHPDLTVASWEPLLATEQLRTARSAFFPRIDATAGYTAQLEPQAVKMGGITAETQQPDYASAGLAVSYVLYDFGKRSARTRSATTALNASRETVAEQRSSVILQVIDTYLSLLSLEKLIQASQEEVTLVQEHRRVAQVLYEEGVVTRNDILQADVRLATARQQVLDLTNRRDNGWLMLNYLTGQKPSFRGELADPANCAATSVVLTDDDAVAPESRHDILALKHRLEGSEAEVIESKRNFYPELFAKGGIDYVENSKVREQAIWYGGIGLRMNLFDGFATTATTEKAVLNRSRWRDTLRRTELKARWEADTARNNLAVAQNRISVAQAAIRQSEENLRINRERYQERVGTATEVLDAQTLHTQTKVDYFRAYYDAQSAAAHLRHALGAL